MIFLLIERKLFDGKNVSDDLFRVDLVSGALQGVVGVPRQLQPDRRSELLPT